MSAEKPSAQPVTRRQFFRNGTRVAALAGLGALGGALAGHSQAKTWVWQIDPAKCLRCGNCATKCVLCWSLPIYFGSKAIDRLIPPESYVRLPDLDEAGVRVVKETLANPDIWNQRLEAMAEARRRGLGDLRLVEWIANNVQSWMGI